MPLFRRPEIPQRVLPRRCIDYLRFRKSFSSRPLSIRTSLSDGGAMKNEEDSATSWALLLWGFRVSRVRERVSKDMWVERFLDQLNVTEDWRILLLLTFRKWEYEREDIMNFTDEQLMALNIELDERNEILRVVALLRDH